MIDSTALKTLFTEARTQNAWTDKPVTDAQLQEIFEITKMGPTSANQQPMRIVFVKSAAEKEKLIACMAPGNVDKTRQAPVSAVIGFDTKFFEHLPRLFPVAPNFKDMFSSNEAAAHASAFRNGTLQAAYFMMAARAVGLDVGGMSGFDTAKVDAAFWAGTSVKTNFICNVGYGDSSKVMGRLPRFEFAEVCKIV
jgi:nitroreductase